jgi:hypothetical protein
MLTHTHMKSVIDYSKWTVPSSWMSRRVVWWKFTSVSEDRTAYVFRAKKSNSRKQAIVCWFLLSGCLLGLLLDSKNEGSAFLRKGGILLLHYTASYPRRWYASLSSSWGPEIQNWVSRCLANAISRVKHVWRRTAGTQQSQLRYRWRALIKRKRCCVKIGKHG